jgi:hypothetical protein
MTEGREMKIIIKYCGLAALVGGAAFCLPNCGDNGTGPTPYTGPWKIVPIPEGLGPGALDGVYFLKPDLGYAVGCGASIIKYDGTRWKIDYKYPKRENEGAGFNDVWFNAPNDGWVVGDWGDGEEQKGLIMHYDGLEWREAVNIPGSIWWECVFFLDEKNGWAGGYGIARWDGSRWNYETDISFITDMYFSSETDGWAVSKYNESIYHYDGATWTRVHDDPWGIELYGIWFTSPDHGWAVGWDATAGDESNIMRYGGGKWFYFQKAPWDEGIRRGINAVHFSGPNNGWAVGQKAFRWDGDNWRYVDSPRPKTGTFTDVFTISEEDAWAVTDGPEILHYEP